MILSFTDLHLGLKHQSKQEHSGLYTSEVEAYKCLDYIYEYCKDPIHKITLVIFKGDWFHTTTPAAIHYKETIKWLTKCNELSIKFIFIPGNHSCTVFSNCLSFIKELGLQNIMLYDSLDELNHFVHEDYNLYFIPYKYSESMKERDVNVESSFKNTITKITTSNNIVISHVQETSAKIGSESLMIAKGVELIDMQDITNVNLILLGHIHRHQIYNKNNMTVVYTGSTYYQDKSDVNQQKGFCVIENLQTVKFVAIPTIRKYHKVSVNSAILENLTPLFTSRKLLPKDVIYFDCAELQRDLSIEDALQSKCVEFNFVYGGTSYLNDSMDLENISVELNEQDNPETMFKNWVNAQEEETELLDVVFNKGMKYINAYYKIEEI